MELCNAYLAAKRIRLQPNMELWRIEAIRNSAISGLGVAFLPKFCVQAQLEAGELIEITTEIAANTLTAVYASRQLSVAGALLRSCCGNRPKNKLALSV